MRWSQRLQLFSFLITLNHSIDYCECQVLHLRENFRLFYLHTNMVAVTDSKLKLNLTIQNHEGGTAVCNFHVTEIYPPQMQVFVNDQRCQGSEDTTAICITNIKQDDYPFQQAFYYSIPGVSQINTTLITIIQESPGSKSRIYRWNGSCYEPELSNEDVCRYHKYLPPNNVSAHFYCLCNDVEVPTNDLTCPYNTPFSPGCNATTTVVTTSPGTVTTPRNTTPPKNASSETSEKSTLSSLFTPSTTLQSTSSTPGSTSQTTQSSSTDNLTSSTGTISLLPSTTSLLPSTTSLLPSTTSLLPSTTSGYPSLDQLANETMSISNVESVLSQTMSYSQERNKLVSHQISDIATILHKASNVFNITDEHTNLILTNLDNTLWANESQWRSSNSSNKIVLDALKSMMINADTAKRITYLKGVNFGFFGHRRMCTSQLNLDDGLADMGSLGFLPLNGTFQQKLNSIRINLTPYCKEGNSEGTHTFFAIYRNRNLFVGNLTYRQYSTSVPLSQRNGGQLSSSDSSLNEHQYSWRYTNRAVDNYADSTMFDLCTRQYSIPEATPVMTGTVIKDGQIVSRADDDSHATGILQFNVSNLLQPLHGSFIVSWWDTENAMWAKTNHCDTKMQNGMLVAYCNHLTDFSMIVDSSPNDAQVCSKTLEIIGYVANGLSIVSLAFVFFINFSAYVDTLGSSKPVRFLNGYFTPKRDPISLAYNGTLLAFYFTFTIFSNQTVARSACQAVAAIAYCLLLSSIILTIFQALRTVSMFLPHIIMPLLRIFLRPMCVITVSLLIPFLIATILFSFTQFFNRQDGFCWVRPDSVVFAIVIPLSILVLNALVCSIFISYRLFGRDRKFSRAGKKKTQALRTKLLALLMMQITLGTPWVLQYFTLFKPGATAWNYIFTIVLGSQGTLLMLLFLVKRRTQAKQASSRRELTSQTNGNSQFESQLKTSQTVLDSESIFDD